MRYHSPFAPNPADWPVLTIKRGEKAVEECNLAFHDHFGRMNPGTYYIRVSFPFAEGKFYPSNLVKFVVGNKEVKEKPDE
jgi:hypothetical protein